MCRIPRNEHPPVAKTIRDKLPADPRHNGYDFVIKITAPDCPGENTPDFLFCECAHFTVTDDRESPPIPAVDRHDRRIGPLRPDKNKPVTRLLIMQLLKSVAANNRIGR